MTVKLGQAKYEKGNRNYFSFKKNQNQFILRILPPMGDLAESGKWSVYHRVEFGYTTSDGKLKPFLSPRKVNYDGMVEVESETHKRRESLKVQQAQAKASGNVALVEQCTKLLMKYNQDAKHHMNVIDLQGNVGLFKIGHRGYQALKAEIERLRSEGVDPLSVENGRFFIFSRSGTGRDTVYTVSEYKKKQVIEGPAGPVEAELAFPHAITDSVLAKLSTDAFELDKVYPTVTPEEEYRIVHEGAVAVDDILGRKNLNKQEDTTATLSANSVLSTDTALPTAAASSVSTGLAVESTDLSTSPMTETVNTALETVATQTSDLSELSDEDFLKKIEGGSF